MEKITRDYHNLQARKIQRVFRRWVKYKKDLAAKRAKVEEEEEEEVDRKKHSRLILKLAAPFRALGRVAKKATKQILQTDLIAKEDRKKFSNAVLTYQVKSILQEGIVDINLTIGEAELKAFNGIQTKLKGANLPYFERIEKDLTGKLGLGIYLWTLQGTGMDCICELVIELKPEISNAAMEVRTEELKEQHIKLLWHKRIPFEFQGICTGIFIHACSCYL